MFCFVHAEIVQRYRDKYQHDLHNIGAEGREVISLLLILLVSNVFAAFVSRMLCIVREYILGTLRKLCHHDPVIRPEHYASYVFVKIVGTINVHQT